MKDFWLCFVPLFVAVDAIGVLPIFFNLTQDVEASIVNRIIYQSVVTATVVALLFLALGSALLNILGITVADFMIAGGILLFVISMSNLIRTEHLRSQIDLESLGAVPIGVPLITGPAVLTTSILLNNEYGFGLTAAAIVINTTIAGVVFSFAGGINKILGKAGSKTVSKIAHLLLAAIAVMMIRKGITAFILSISK